jgi:prolyl-tRNA synthetase
MPQTQLVRTIEELLSDFQERLFQRAKEFRERYIRTDITTFEEMRAFFTPKNEEKPEIHGGFVKAKWCGDMATEELLKEFKVTIRSIPFNQSGTQGRCVVTGRPATIDAIFAKSY